MPLPHVVARFNRRVTNRFVEPIARRSSGFAVVHHVGRRSGRSHRTPVNVFVHDDDLIVVLTYGIRADWVRNVLAGPATIERSGTASSIAAIEIVDRDDVRSALPTIVLVVLRLLRVREAACLKVVPSD